MVTVIILNLVLKEDLQSCFQFYLKVLTQQMDDYM